jgi:hypothetical protein
MVGEPRSTDDHGMSRAEGQPTWWASRARQMTTA